MATTTTDVRQSLENLRLERDAIWLYEALAAIDADPKRQGAFHHIAENERRHAAIWAAWLEQRGVAVPPPRGPRSRVRLIALIARVFGTAAVADLVRALEGEEEALYQAQSSPEVASIAADEAEHARIWDRLGGESREVLRDRIEPSAAAAGIAAAAAVTTPTDIARSERWHRASRSGTFRAVVFGVSDGLVSNLALVMGVAGAAADEPQLILLAGVAGLLAGAFSMAAGEYVSMQSQREVFERQIELERAEMAAMPEEEEAELAAVYRAKGFTPSEAAGIAHRIFADPDLALDTLVREELGLDPGELGSAWGAAGGSFVAFALGAVVPVLPFIVGGGLMAVAASVGLSLVALFVVGVGVSLLTGRSALYSGGRQVALGAGAAVITYAVGSIIGVGVVG
jgi:VIT1/CCC1 family predicted Fe2+/Mn2+ transporter